MPGPMVRHKTSDVRAKTPDELAALLLLVATIGAIAIAGRRSEELR